MPATQSRDGLNPDVIKALGHPMRLDALRIWNECAMASPNEVADRMGVDVRNLAHHVRVLRDCGCLELVDTAQRRGATEHFYSATKRAVMSFDITQLLPKSTREGFTATMLEAILKRISEAVEAETFDSRFDRHLGWIPLTLDEDGWKEFVDLKARHLEEELELDARCQERQTGAGGTVIRATALSLLFESPSPAK